MSAFPRSSFSSWFFLILQKQVTSSWSFTLQLLQRYTVQ
jgi:hypothetical protein